MADEVEVAFGPGGALLEFPAVHCVVSDREAGHVSDRVGLDVGADSQQVGVGGPQEAVYSKGEARVEEEEEGEELEDVCEGHGEVVEGAAEEGAQSDPIDESLEEEQVADGDEDVVEMGHVHHPLRQLHLQPLLHRHARVIRALQTKPKTAPKLFRELFSQPKFLF